MKRKIHSWRRGKRKRPTWSPLPADRERRVQEKRRVWLLTKGSPLRCFCKKCMRQDKKERWGEKWQLSMLPLMGVTE